MVTEKPEISLRHKNAIKKYIKKSEIKEREEGDGAPLRGKGVKREGREGMGGKGRDGNKRRGGRRGWGGPLRGKEVERGGEGYGKGVL